jgi:hypothetical protein
VVDNQDEIEIEEFENESEAPQVEESGDDSNELRDSLRAAIEESEAITEEKPAGRSRDERGRFAAQKQISDQATQDEGSEAVEEQPIAPPYSWSAEHKEQFAQLPRQMQEYLTRREQERESFIGRKSQEVKSIQDRFAPVDRLIQKYGETFQRANVDPVQGIESLILAQQYLDRDPVGALKLMAQSYGLDLSQLAGGAEQSSNSQAYPQMHYLTNELQNIRGKLAALEQEKMAQQQRHAIGEVESFANEVDKTGKLVRPFMADVHDQMMEEIPLIRARNPELSGRQILQTAYETACWKNPNVRGRLIEQQQQPQMQAARVQQARLAGSSVRGAPGASALASTNGSSVRDALLAAMEAHS